MKPSAYGPFACVPLPARHRLIWRGGARLALWVTAKIEFFGLDGNVPGQNNERIPALQACYPPVRNRAVRDYGSHIGIWRIFEVMQTHLVDVRYRDGASNGRVLGVPIHSFITGSPQRIDAFDRALSDRCSHDGVWLATGSEIADGYTGSTG